VFFVVDEKNKGKIEGTKNEQTGDQKSPALSLSSKPF